MARASRQVRKVRRIRRERGLAFKMADMALRERDHARTIANMLETELKKRDKAEIISIQAGNEQA